MSNLVVRKASIEEIVALSHEIPELGTPPKTAVYTKKIGNKPSLALIAEINGVAAGFKVGYEREGYWYSWLGGVHPNFRRRGVARALADAQDEWARQKGYPHVTFKTLNRLRNMLKFAINRGFNIIKIDEEDNIEEYRIWLRRNL